MNGARSIFMRKGYWLTALAAIVLLAASPGTASAQVTATASKTVTEGDSLTVTVNLKGMIPAATDADTPTDEVTATVTAIITEGSATAIATGGDIGDISTNLGLSVDFAIPENATLSPVSYSGTRTFSVRATHDVDAEDEAFEWMSFTLVGGGLEDADESAIQSPSTGIPTTLTILDDETQTYTLTLTPSNQKPDEGDDVTVSLKAEPAHVQDSKLLTLNIDKPAPDYSLDIVDDAGGDVTDSPSVTIGGPSVADSTETATITVMTDDNDGNREDDTVTLTAYSGRAGASVLEDSLTISLADLHALPAVAMIVVDKDDNALDPQPTSVAEGESVMVAVMVVNKDGDTIKAAEDLKVALMPTGTADSADYTLVGSSDIKMDAEMSGLIEIKVRSDEDVGMESLMFDAVVSGESDIGPGTRTSAAVLSLDIEDETAKKIEPKSSPADYEALMAAIAEEGGDDGVNPGDTVTLMTSDLFEVAPGYTASYGVSVEGDSASASASGESVTINALMAGEAKITVTGTARMASSSLMPSQSVSNVAELTFPVMVEDTTLEVTLSADPMEIAAGGMSTITAMANRAVTVGDGEVAIALAVVGDGTLDAESIMIAMGEMSGSAMLTANESVTVVATGSGVTGLMQVKVTVTDAPDPDAPDPDAPDPDAPDPDVPEPDVPDPDVPEPVPTPALPLIAQWLLGLGLMGGGARQLFRRRRQG